MPALRQGWMRRLIALWAALAMAMVACSSPGSGGGPTRFDASLEKSVGVFGVSDPEDIPALRQNGIGLVVAPYGTMPSHLRDSMMRARIGIIDSTIKTMVYKEMCPSGPQSCLRPTDRMIDRLTARVTRHVRQTRSVREIAGYYILDDNYAAMGRVLRAVGAAVHREAPNTPTVCPFFLPLTRGSGGAAAALQTFKGALRNYSPEWCDTVMIYSYVRPTRLPSLSSIGWNMSSTLPTALRMLSARGWDESRSTLIGAPQAFGYSPRISTKHGKTQMQFRTTPSATHLRRQVRAFCEAGARSIVAFVWSGQQGGKVQELKNSPRLRRGLKAGVNDCRRRW